ncbi:MAG: hypothetical protein U0M72_05680 [Eggerthellaceae bacterium]
MVVLVIAVALLCMRIHCRDMRERLVYGTDVLLLIALRLVVMGTVVLARILGGANAVFGLTYEQWGARALLESLVWAAAISVLLWVIGYLVTRVRSLSTSAIGAGDIQLYFACGLFLYPLECIALVYASALVGVVLAIIAKVRNRENTFAFAPAIVWPFLLLVLLKRF